MSVYESSITNPKKQLEFYKDLSEHLQQENQDLKEKIILLKASEPMLELEKYYGERDKYKEVIEEVREYIDENTELEHDGDEYGYTEWVNIKPQNIVFINELLQILDKAKGE